MASSPCITSPSVVSPRKDGQLKLEIDVTNDLLKKMPTHFGNSEAGIILKAITDQGQDLEDHGYGHEVVRSSRHRDDSTACPAPAGWWPCYA